MMDKGIRNILMQLEMLLEEYPEAYWIDDPKSLMEIEAFSFYLSFF